MRHDHFNRYIMAVVAKGLERLEGGRDKWADYLDAETAGMATARPRVEV